MIAFLWALFISALICLSFTLGTIRGHDEEHIRCRHED